MDGQTDRQEDLQTNRPKDRQQTNWRKDQKYGKQTDGQTFNGRTGLKQAGKQINRRTLIQTGRLIDRSADKHTQAYFMSERNNYLWLLFDAGSAHRTVVDKWHWYFPDCHHLHTGRHSALGYFLFVFQWWDLKEASNLVCHWNSTWSLCLAKNDGSIQGWDWCIPRCYA